MLFMSLLFFGLLLMIFFFFGGGGGGLKFYQSFHHHPPSEWKKYWDRYLALTWLILLITKYFSFEMYFSDHYEIHVLNFRYNDTVIWPGPGRFFFGRGILCKTYVLREKSNPGQFSPDIRVDWEYVWLGGVSML